MLPVDKEIIDPSAKTVARLKTVGRCAFEGGAVFPPRSRLERSLLKYDPMQSPAELSPHDGLRQSCRIVRPIRYER